MAKAQRDDDDGDKKAKLKYKVPKTIGGAIDLLYSVRLARKKAEAEGKAEKRQESMIEALIFERFGKSELEGAKGKKAQASIKRSDVPTFKSDKKFFAHLRKHPEDMDLLQRRLSIEACRARWANKKIIPGIEIFTKIWLSLTKRG